MWAVYEFDALAAMLWHKIHNLECVTMLFVALCNSVSGSPKLIWKNVISTLPKTISKYRSGEQKSIAGNWSSFFCFSKNPHFSQSGSFLGLIILSSKLIVRAIKHDQTTYSTLLEIE
jgi:hypothetical protein